MKYFVEKCRRLWYNKRARSTNENYKRNCPYAKNQKAQPVGAAAFQFSGALAVLQKVPRFDRQKGRLEAVCQKMLPGFGELMRQTSLQYVPTAILSRQTAGIRNQTLIINLPGKPKSIRECLDAVFPAVPYCLDLIGAAYLETNENIIKAFRPKSS